MTRALMTARTKRLAVDVIRFCTRLPPSEEGRIIARQLMRAATSVGANYRAA
jgi:four helix bundle protein